MKNGENVKKVAFFIEFFYVRVEIKAQQFQKIFLHLQNGALDPLLSKMNVVLEVNKYSLLILFHYLIYFFH